MSDSRRTQQKSEKKEQSKSIQTELSLDDPKTPAQGAFGSQTKSAIGSLQSDDQPPSLGDRPTKIS